MRKKLDEQVEIDICYQHTPGNWWPIMEVTRVPYESGIDDAILFDAIGAFGKRLHELTGHHIRIDRKTERRELFFFNGEDGDEE